MLKEPSVPAIRQHCWRQQVRCEVFGALGRARAPHPGDGRAIVLYSRR
jgi:hypothetical protein